MLPDIKPSEQEEKEMLEAADVIVREIQSRFQDARVILGGSGAKGTWIKNEFDVDLFVAFDYEKYKARSDELADIVHEKIKDLNPERLHGSRDYFQVHDDFVYEIIPILDIKDASEALNITDVSPLHAEWVIGHSDERMRNDIRLVKKFFKSQRLYGAESYIHGFSGYVLEILTIHYGGFEEVVKAISKWTDKTVVDVEKYHKDALFELNASKTKGPLIIIDPVTGKGMPTNSMRAINSNFVPTYFSSLSRFFSTMLLNFLSYQGHLRKCLCRYFDNACFSSVIISGESSVARLFSDSIFPIH